MAVIINATTTQGLVVTPDYSGQIQFQKDGVNLPSPTVAPAFSVYTNNPQLTMSSTTWTKVTNFTTKRFDTNSNFDTTNAKFLPTVAGYYLFNIGVPIVATSGAIAANGVALYKNGSVFQYYYNGANSSASDAYIYGSAVVYMNGSTDYVEVYAYAVGTSPYVRADATQSLFDGCLLRGA